MRRAGLWVVWIWPGYGKRDAVIGTGCGRLQTCYPWEDVMTKIVVETPAANANSRRLAKARIGGLEYSLIGKRAGAR